MKRLVPSEKVRRRKTVTLRLQRFIAALKARFSRSPSELWRAAEERLRKLERDRKPDQP
jgi:hypothetical protein